jgi:hypothetical protein
VLSSFPVCILIVLLDHAESKDFILLFLISPLVWLRPDWWECNEWLKKTDCMDWTLPKQTVKTLAQEGLKKVPYCMTLLEIISLCNSLITSSQNKAKSNTGLMNRYNVPDWCDNNSIQYLTEYRLNIKHTWMCDKPQEIRRMTRKVKPRKSMPGESSPPPCPHLP